MSLKKLFKKYEEYPSFLGLKITDVSMKGLFGEEPLHVAAIIGDIDDIRLLLNHGAHINSKGEDGFTPLHEAVLQGNLKVAQFLLESGADVHLKDNDGCTSIDIARELNNDEMIRLLVHYIS